jgi:hypothetical protein
MYYIASFTLFLLFTSISKVHSQTPPNHKFFSIVGESTATPAAATVNPASTQDPEQIFTYEPNGPPSIATGTSTMGVQQTPTSSDVTCTSDCIPTIYTTGFAGFTTLTVTSTTRFLTTSQQPDGVFSVYPVTSSVVNTVAFSGVPHVSYTTYVTGSTVTETQTANVGGSLTTFTATNVRVATTSVAFPVSNGGTIQTGLPMKNAAALFAAGAAVAFL